MEREKEEDTEDTEDTFPPSWGEIWREAIGERLESVHPVGEKEFVLVFENGMAMEVKSERAGAVREEKW